MCITVLLIIAVIPVLSIDVSVGGSFGLGLPLFRGSAYEEIQSSLGQLGGFGGSAEESKFAYAPQIDAVIVFNPFVAVETGVGFLSSVETRTVSIFGGSTESVMKRTQITIPVMIRGSYEYGLDLGPISSGITYLSAGAKLGLPVASYSTSTGSVLGVTFSDEVDAASFVLDIAFAVGQEFKFAEKHFLGMRVGYDLNVLTPLDEDATSNLSGSDVELFHDNLLFGITYRYMF